MLGKKHARRATSEAERTSVLVHVLLTRPSAHVRGGTERPHEEGDMQNEALLENIRVHGPQTECVLHFHCPCQLAVLATSSDHLPCTIIIIADKHPAGSSKTGAETKLNMHRI